jgi:hypothetical protein
MSTIKRISGPYTIQTLNLTDQINLNTPTVFINGNLVVTGNSQSVVSTDTAINDHTITLNNGVISPNPLGANIIIARSLNGSSANVFLSWNETLHVWQSYNGTTVSNLASASATIANIYADSAPAISANLDLRKNSIWDSTNNSNVQLFVGNLGNGGTGIHVTNTQYTDKEIMLKQRSIAYSILFG